MIADNRVVIDTNVLISALVFGGTPRQVTDLTGLGVLVPVVAEEDMTELRRVVRLKFPEFQVFLAQLEKLLERYAVWVHLGSADVKASRDPDDDKFIETALLGGCDYLISGDRDLLDLGSYQAIAILRPADMLQILQKNERKR